MALPKQAASAVRHHHRRERHVWILTGDLPEEQSWESCLRYKQTLMPLNCWGWGGRQGHVMRI